MILCVCRYLSYASITRLFASLILILAVPLPYYLRLLVYYSFEAPEITARKEAAEALGFKDEFASSLLQYLTPLHPLLVTMYILYLVSFIGLAIYQRYRLKTFEEIVLGSLNDLRNLNRIECLRLILSHILLPFEKFGLCVGAVVAVFYWPFALPLALLTTIVYMIPTLYLTGRLTIQSRPWFVRKVRIPYVPRSQDNLDGSAIDTGLDILSLGVTSIESCMLLNNISPHSNRNENVPHHTHSLTWACIRRELARAIVGLLCVLWMFSVLLMYGEALGFFLQVGPQRYFR